MAIISSDSGRPGQIPTYPVEHDDGMPTGPSAVSWGAIFAGAAAAAALSLILLMLGVGLGLSLVRQIADQHGGSVRCEARSGGGSCFTLVLPPCEPTLSLPP